MSAGAGLRRCLSRGNGGGGGCRALAVALAATLVAGGAWRAAAAEYPAKQVNIIVPYTKGSATDNFARLVGEKLAAVWGQPVVVDNLPGAAGKEAATKAAPDGCTLLVESASYVFGPALAGKSPDEVLKSFVDIAPFARQPHVLVVGSGAGMKSVSELIARAKAGELKFGSAGVGTTTHLAAERFASVAGFKAVHFPYKGGPEANAGTEAGAVTYWFPPVAMAMKDVKEGRLLALAVTSGKRVGVLPDVPTMAEAGVQGVELSNWWGLWAPAGIPAGVQEKLVKDVAGVLAAPEVREKFETIGAEPMSMTPAEFSKFVRGEMEAAARIVKAAGLRQ